MTVPFRRWGAQEVRGSAWGSGMGLCPWRVSVIIPPWSQHRPPAPHLDPLPSILPTAAAPGAELPGDMKQQDVWHGGSQAGASVQFNPVAQSCPTLCDPMNCSTSGLPVHHKLPEFTQTRAHRVSDAIQPSHLLSPSPPAPNPSQHQCLFQ